MVKRTPIICILGPTGVGKTELSLRLYDSLPCEIISVDSAKIYRRMDIGTAKPDINLLKRVPYHLINICNPTEKYSVAQFRKDALEKINEIKGKRKVPLLVGGTMLYFRQLQQGLSQLPSANSEVREKLSAEAMHKGWDFLHRRLIKLDPMSAAYIHPHDGQRIQRALEVFYLTGKPMSNLKLAAKKANLPYTFLNIALFPSNRGELHKRIAQRFMGMLEKGFIQEVKALYQDPDLSIELPAIRTVGYRQVWQYLSGEFSQEVLPEKAIAATRQLAKRQLTWLRSWNNLQMFDAFASETSSRIIEYVRNHQEIKISFNIKK